MIKIIRRRLGQWLRWAILLMVAPAALLSQAQARNGVEGQYLLDLFGRDSVGHERVTERILLVLTATPVAASAAGRAATRGGSGAAHAACWHAISTDPRAPSTPTPTQARWERIRDSVVVSLWASVDAGQELRFAVRPAGLRGTAIFWAHNGSRGRDSLIGTRTGPADPRKC